MFERQRRATPVIEDLRRFRELLEEPVQELPEAVTTVVTDPSETPAPEDYPMFRGLSSIAGVTSSGAAEELYFPKPFNREQVEVVQRLERRSGVVVQGPPGTGKTHTIANIISHYLATGRRVLVTSQRAPALKVLRHQLPAAIRPLAVSLLESDREGLKQFRESVETIQQRLQRLSRGQTRRDIDALASHIDGLHRRLAQIDHDIDAIGRSAAMPIHLQSEDIPAVQAAREVAAAGDLARWLPDAIGPEPQFDPQMTAADLRALREARQALKSDLAYLDAPLPAAGTPDDDEPLLETHRRLGAAETLRRQVEAGTITPLRDKRPETFAQLRAVVERLRRLQHERRTVASSNRAWAADLLAALRGSANHFALDSLEAMRGQIDDVVAEERHFLLRPVTLPATIGDHSRFREAVARLAEGQPAFGLLRKFLERELDSQLQQVRIAGGKPGSPADWADVGRYLAALDSCRRVVAGWDNAVPLARFDPVGEANLSCGRRMAEQLDLAGRLRALAVEERALQAEVQALLPRWTDGLQDEAALTACLDAAEAHLEWRDHSEALEHRSRMIDALDGDTPIQQSMTAFLRAKLGLPDVPGQQFLDEWRALRVDLARLRALAPAFDAVRRITGLIQASGAPMWADRLRREPVSGVEDQWLPGDWDARWRLCRLDAWLVRTDRHRDLRRLGDERKIVEDDLRKTYERSIEQKTWLALAEAATDAVKAALAGYALAVARIGRGTGKSANRYRREARSASERAKGALPCWIMPHHRVSESLPSEFGMFDLVIIDEASQSTIAALPALLRARKLLVVGDDKQVVPENVGLDIRRSDELAGRHLRHQVPSFRSYLRQEQSLYDMASVIFAGSALMLKEHFRCVAPIIEFSKARFYYHQLLPLRLPTASERLDPPLVDVLVEDGYRTGKVNKPEAEFIVEEIARIAADPAMSRRSIGVTTLLGQEQAAHIQSLVERNLDAEIIQRHDVLVGDPSFFQGNERDIMFISLVAEQNDSSLSGDTYNRRFNVAASRARDRMILVRSVEPEQLRHSDSLRRALIQHFRAPFANEAPVVEDRRERCESGFERDMFDVLVERGYRVDTQVRVGSHRIDLVVEGEGDRRLGIECDGDRFHGPEHWPDDMTRQRTLERAGWTIWRCFASRFVRDRQEVVEELVAYLAELGIAPVGNGEAASSRHCGSRRWRSSAADAEGAAGSEPRPNDETDVVPEVQPNDAQAPPGEPEGLAPVASLLRMADPPFYPPLAPQEHDPLAERGRSAELFADSAREAVVDQLISGRSKLSVAEAEAVLHGYRAQVIESEFPGAEPNRCLLRSDMIRALIKNGCESRSDFTRACPHYLRAATDSRQLKFLDDVIEILSLIERR